MLRPLTEPKHPDRVGPSSIRYFRYSETFDFGDDVGYLDNGSRLIASFYHEILAPLLLFNRPGTRRCQQAFPVDRKEWVVTTETMDGNNCFRTTVAARVHEDSLGRLVGILGRALDVNQLW